MPPPPPNNSGHQPPPPGYSPYANAGYQMQQGHPQATTVLVLGILGLAVCQILGIFAWVMGNKALKEIDANPSMYNNRGTVNAGRICGIVATVLMALGVVLAILVIAAAASQA